MINVIRSINVEAYPFFRMYSEINVCIYLFLQSKKYLFNLFKSRFQFSHFTPERHKDVHYSLRPSYGLMACFARPITEYAPIPISPN